MGSLAKQLGGQSQVKVFAKGGAVKHDDAVEDKKLILKTLKEKKLMKKGGKCKC